MKKITFTIALMLFCFVFMQAQDVEWSYLTDNNQKRGDISLLKSSDEEITVQFKLNAIGLEQVESPNGTANIVVQEKGSPIHKQGAPDLWKVSKSVIISDYSKTEIEVIESDFYEINDIEIAPSKGVLSRTVNPEDVAFEYGAEYSTDAFFPSEVAQIDEPYIIRDYRGQTIHFQPYQYNPVTKVLRVYTSITVRVNTLDEVGVNTLKSTKSAVSVDEVYAPIYNNHFLNYTSTSVKASLSESNPTMLIITYDDFADEMASFVEWKESIGIDVEMVNYSTIGSASAIKTYVQDYYDNNGLTYLLLVGDDDQVPTSSTDAGDSDNNYAYVSGDDHYADIFVGRFSAEDESDVETMVERTLYYERDMSSDDALITTAIGIASNEGTGGGGDDGESDEVHMNNIEDDLEGYGYSVNQCYQDGGSTLELSSLINTGAGLINYVGHGNNTAWNAPSFSNDEVDELTNTEKFPFIVSVACLVGNFTDITCFAESWLRATSNGEPTGAVAFCGSTISQSWASPMHAQDEMNDLLVADTYMTCGAIFINGVFAMIDAYDSDGEDMADTWTCFGDPSVQTRTPGHADGPDSDDDGTTSCGSTDGLTVSDIAYTSATLSWSEVSDVESYTLAYKASSASTWTEVTLEATSYALSDLTEATSYQFKVKTNCAEGSSSYTSAVAFTTEGDVVVVIEYCDSEGGDVRYEWIDFIELNELSNTTGADGGYADYTSLSASVYAGDDATVTFSCGFKSNSYTEYWHIWIDWNADGSFDSDEEMVSTSSSSNGELSESFTVPSSATVGSTVMRVTMKYNDEATSCESFSYGEVEDYTINVLGRSRGVSETAIADAELVVYPNPTSNFVEIKYSDDSDLGLINIYNTSGKRVKSIDSDKTYETIDVSDLPNGVYSISIQSADKVVTQRLIVN